MLQLKGKMIDNLRQALAECDYDLEDIMNDRTRRREYVDLRSITWYIYQEASCCSPGQISRVFGWNRTTVYSALRRVEELHRMDSRFRSLYDRIHSQYAKSLENTPGNNYN